MSISTPNLEYHRKRAKVLLKALQSGEDAARQRFSALQLSIETAQLTDAQLVIARENGYFSWPRLKHHIENLKPETQRPYVRELEWYRDRAEGLVRSHNGGMTGTNSLLRSFLPKYAGLDDDRLNETKIELDDTQSILAQQHGFESWAEFAAYISALENGSGREPFLLAFEAIKAGDVGILRQLLGEIPSLATAQGTNGNSLLNLAMNFQREEIRQLLLDVGAPVNLGNNYGWTPLHQAAVGDSISWMEKLICDGGDLTLSARGDGGTPLVQALFWGKADMADAIAEHDITPRNLRVAAGLGRFDLLDECFEIGFDAPGDMKQEAGNNREFYRPHGGFPNWKPTRYPHEILNEAFTYACRNGRTDVLEFLLERGASISADPYRGTGLIWAAYRDHRDTVRWLMEHGADINQKATFGGPSHGVGVTALHLVVQNGDLDRVRFLIELGADPNIPDDLYNATAIGWAEFFGHTELKEYLSGLS